MPTEGRRLHSNGLSEETSSVLRDGGNDGNKIGENSGDISDNKETGIRSTEYGYTQNSTTQREI